jgi:hypothetical protein
MKSFSGRKQDLSDIELLEKIRLYQKQQWVDYGS